MRAAITGLGAAFVVLLALPGPASACRDNECDPVVTTIPSGTPDRPPTEPTVEDRPTVTTIEERPETTPPSTTENRPAATTTTDLTEVGLPPVPTFARVSAQSLTAPEGTVLPETGISIGVGVILVTAAFVGLIGTIGVLLGRGSKS